jgi:spore coat protein CotH
VRIKGQGSFQPIWVKPSLKIKFDLYDEDLRFIGGLNRLTLNNMTNDYTMMHERMAYRLYREAEVPASRAGHAVLTINDEPYGLYTSLETVDSDMIRRWYSDEGVLYEGWDCDLKDAYIDNFELEFGDDEVGRAQLAAAANALEFVNGDAALEAVGEYVDWEQFVRFWAAEAVMGQFDSYPYSSPGDDYFLYLDPDDGLFDYLPWGNDETFSSPTYTVTYSTGIMGQVCNQSSSCQALFREQVWDILTIAEDYDWLAYHDEIAAQIQPYVEADDHKVYSDMTVSTYQSSMRDFVNSRESRLEQMLGPRP